MPSHMSAAQMKAWFDSKEFEQAYHCDAPLGALLEENSTHFSLWAPTARQVQLNLYHNGSRGAAYRTVPMKKQAHGLWVHEESERLHGTYYDYDVSVGSSVYRTADPYAKACGLNGARSMVVDLRKTDPHGWAADRAPRKQKEDVIYEIHIKDFSWDPHSGVPAAMRGKFAALTLGDTTLDSDGVHPTCLNHVKRLGATHIQLMPIYDYGSVDEAGDDSAFNWGYDPVNYNVPEGSYSSDPARGEVRIRELKEAIMSLHKSGFRVIMDVVYNHTYHLDSWLFRTVPWYFYRQNEDGTASNGSGCGNEIASERSMCARYILDSVLYWASEYHIDGFRFDLMGMLDTSLMNRIQQQLDIKYGKGEKLLYGEPWAGGACHPREGVHLAHKGNTKRLMPSIGAFCDNTRDALKGSVMQAESHGFVNGGGLNAGHLACCVRGWSGEHEDFAAPSQTITYLSSHDDWTLWDKLICSMSSQRDFDTLHPEVLQANRLAIAMLSCCQGHLFMLSGEEFARTKQGIRDSYASPVTINRLDWRRACENHALVEYYRGLIALRKQQPCLCDKSAKARERVLAVCQPEHDMAAILMDNMGASQYSQLFMLFNASHKAASVDLPQGSWQVLADGESSFRWQQQIMMNDKARLPPMTAMILGLKQHEAAQKK